MKVLITGAKGQLGRGLIATAPSTVDLHPVTRDDCDLADASAIAALIQQVAPDLVINAAAYTAVDKAERDEDARGEKGGAAGDRGLDTLENDHVRRVPDLVVVGLKIKISEMLA